MKKRGRVCTRSSGKIGSFRIISYLKMGFDPSNAILKNNISCKHTIVPNLN